MMLTITREPHRPAQFIFLILNVVLFKQRGYEPRTLPLNTFIGHKITVFVSLRDSKFKSYLIKSKIYSIGSVGVFLYLSQLFLNQTIILIKSLHTNLGLLMVNANLYILII